MRIIVCRLFIIGFIALQGVGAKTVQEIQNLLPEFETYITKAMTDWDVPGAAVIVVKDGQTVMVKGFGVKRAQSNDPVDESTIFNLVSLTKTFTVSVLAMLVDEGKIKWDDKVIHYLPDFKLHDPITTQTMTIRDLVSHRSGYPGFAADTLTELLWPQEKIYHILNKIPADAPLGQSYAYQNIFVGIAGMIIEKVCNKPLAEIYEERLFNPLGMYNTSLGDGGLTGKESLWRRLKVWWHDLKTYKNRSYLHDVLDGKARYLIDGNPAIYCFPASRGLTSSAQDMVHWLKFQLNYCKINDQALISAANVQAMRTPQIHIGAPQGGHLFPKERVPNIDYGMGWFIHTFGGIDMISHMGGMSGSRTLISISPNEKVGIIILSNLGGMRVSLFPEAIRAKFFDLYNDQTENVDWSQQLMASKRKSREELENKYQAYRVSSPQPALPLVRYIGEYDNDLYGRVTITLDKEKLYLSYHHEHQVALQHWNGNGFRFIGSELSVGFSGTDKGEVLFGSEKAGQIDVMTINLLQEGGYAYFRKVIPRS